MPNPSDLKWNSCNYNLRFLQCIHLISFFFIVQETFKHEISREKKTAKMLREYLLEKDLDPEFEKSSNKDSNNVLVYFYINARKINGEKYKCH